MSNDRSDWAAQAIQGASSRKPQRLRMPPDPLPEPQYDDPPEIPVSIDRSPGSDFCRVTFARKPPWQIRQDLKRAGFRWCRGGFHPLQEAPTMNIAGTQVIQGCDICGHDPADVHASDGRFYCRPCWKLATGVVKGLDAIAARNAGTLGERIARLAYFAELDPAPWMEDDRHISPDYPRH